MKIPDNYDLWAAHDARQSRLLERLPKCCHCGETIQEERAVRIDFCWYCAECLNDEYTFDVEPEDDFDVL